MSTLLGNINDINGFRIPNRLVGWLNDDANGGILLDLLLGAIEFGPSTLEIHARELGDLTRTSDLEWRLSLL